MYIEESLREYINMYSSPGTQDYSKCAVRKVAGKEVSDESIRTCRSKAKRDCENCWCRDSYTGRTIPAAVQEFCLFKDKTLTEWPQSFCQLNELLCGGSPSLLLVIHRIIQKKYKMWNVAENGCFWPFSPFLWDEYAFIDSIFCDGFVKINYFMTIFGRKCIVYCCERCFRMNWKR